MSTFTVPVVRIGKIGKHPNADTLSITEVEGCPVVFRTGDFNPGDLAIYVPVEAVVPASVPGTEWLGSQRRIKAKKLRGIFSMGLLLPTRPTLPLPEPGGTGPVGYKEGEDVAEILSITKYEEPEPLVARSEDARPPAALAPVYDVESYRKFKHQLSMFETVWVTEKIHGTNARFVFEDKQLHVGTHRNWKKKDDRNLWWRAAERYGLTEKLLPHPGMVVYGEVYGQVQDLKYGCEKGEVRLAVFDILRDGRFLDYDEFQAFCTSNGLPTVPTLYLGPYSPTAVEYLANGKSTIADNIREGFVIRPIKERWNNETGRTILKLLSEDYLTRKGGTEHH